MRAGSLSLGCRYELTESLVWQRSSHRLRFGFDWEHTTFSAQVIDQEPATIILYSPGFVKKQAPQISLPTSFLTLDDILGLPLQSFRTSVGPGDSAA